MVYRNATFFNGLPCGFFQTGFMAQCGESSFYIGDVKTRAANDYRNPIQIFP